MSAGTDEKVTPLQDWESQLIERASAKLGAWSAPLIIVFYLFSVRGVMTLIALAALFGPALYSSSDNTERLVTLQADQVQATDGLRDAVAGLRADARADRAVYLQRFERLEADVTDLRARTDALFAGHPGDRARYEGGR
ncbi:hypothetical protein JN531_012335 [Flagellatimonas centrodinii]|uniref:hypothetical protein n=1 Tax=Flagellatimonas centrodinii TaxID=2806210 RepID=UPI001FEDF590|nr:hypothetical protein [Flagellatimonas centrodinii]ULQ45888.1 hypothetical protein JN531_012335 [Flagellatimonas centrodinii]